MAKKRKSASKVKRKRVARKKRSRSPPPLRPASSSKPKRSVSKPTRVKKKARRSLARPTRRKSARRVHPKVVAAPLPRPTRRIAVKSRVRLKQSIELLRKHVAGYGAKDGFSLTDLEKWDYNKRYRVIRRAEKISELIATPHDLVRARTKKEKKNLLKFTGQRIRGAKHFIVHKPADNFRVGLSDGHVTIDGSFDGQVISRNQFFLFPRKPRYPKELVAMSKRLLKEMPDGFYTVLTAAHGDSGEPFERAKLIEHLQQYLSAYEVDSEGHSTGYADHLLGFRFMQTTLQGAIVQRRDVDARRQRQKEYNRELRAKAEADERARLKKLKKRKR